MNLVSSVGRVFSTVSEFYKDLNPATLSGAIDVVVVEQPDGSLKCSPFHVRFGKMHLLRPQEKVVEIRVNGNLVNFPMKVGEAGEAFFVMETLNPVPFELETSPLSLPQPINNAMSLEELDLDAGTGGLPSPTHSMAGDGGEKIMTVCNADTLGKPRPLDLEKKETDTILLSDAEGVASAFMSPSSAKERDFELMFGMTSVDKLADEQKPLDIEVAPQTNIERLVHSAGPISVSNVTTPIEITYPLSDTEVELGISPPQTNWDRPIHRNQGGPLSDTELDYSNYNDYQPQKTWNWRWGDFPSERPPEKREISPVKQEEAAVPEVALENLPPTIVNQAIAEGLQSTHLSSSDWEMSLCGANITEETASERFESYIVSYKIFTSTPNILDNPDLIFRYKKKSYYTWQFVAPLLVAQSLFQKSPSPESLQTNLDQTKLEISPGSLADKRASQVSFTDSWKIWWNRSSVSGSTPASAGASPVAQEPRRAFSAHETRLIQQLPAVNGFSPLRNEDSPKRYTKTLRLTSEQLKSLNLKYGANEVSFTVNSSYSGKATCSARLFLWKNDVTVVISDIDGTITKSDALGHLFSMVGKDWTHPGIANLYTKIHKNGYEFLFLTSRAIGQADWTRMYLKGIEQGSYQLPDGPVIMSPDRLIAALKREVIDRRPEEFKIAALTDIRKLFVDKNPFYAGFGNRITDALSYRAVEIPAYRIYSIDPNGNVKMDFFYGYSSSYVKLTDLVDHIFPHLKRHIEVQLVTAESSEKPSRERTPSVYSQDEEKPKKLDESYNDYHFWKNTPVLPDIPELGTKEENAGGYSTDWEDDDYASDTSLTLKKPAIPSKSSSSIIDYVLGNSSSAPLQPIRSSSTTALGVIPPVKIKTALKTKHPMAEAPVIASPESDLQEKEDTESEQDTAKGYPHV